MLALVLSGILVTTQNGNELARESWRDDGNLVISEVKAMGVTFTFAVDRKRHTLSIEQGGQKVDIALPAGAAALPNLDWAAWTVLAEQFKDASKPTPFKAVLGPERSVDASITVKKTARGERELTVNFPAQTVHVTVDAHGQLVHGDVPAQGVEVKPASASAAPVKRPPPPGVVEEPFELDNRAAKIAGVVDLPEKRAGKVPVVIVIAGSGPVDRDGNEGGMLRTDVYRQLAEALARRGIATIRYDKRGVGSSKLDMPLDQLTFDDFVSDAAAVVAMARGNDKLGAVYLFGHSEGSLLALRAAQSSHVEGIVSAAGAGRPIAELLKDQFARQLPFDEMKEYDSLVDAVRTGKPLAAKSPALRMLFQPTLAKFLRGQLLTDPRPLAKQFAGKLTVVQGDNDTQVTVEHDAEPLAAAHPGAKLVVLHGVAHPLKHDTHLGTDQPSYRDPSLPIDPGVVEAVISTIR